MNAECRLPAPVGPANRRGRVHSYPHTHGRVYMDEYSYHVRFVGDDARARAVAYQAEQGGTLEQHGNGVVVYFEYGVANPDST